MEHDWRMVVRLPTLVESLRDTNAQMQQFIHLTRKLKQQNQQLQMQLDAACGNLDTQSDTELAPA